MRWASRASSFAIDWSVDFIWVFVISLETASRSSKKNKDIAIQSLNACVSPGVKGDHAHFYDGTPDSIDAQ